MRKFRLATAVFAAMLASACATAGGGAPARTEAIANPSVLDRAGIVADWQLRHMEDFSYVSTFREQTADPIDWIQAAFFVGLTDFADATGDPRYVAAIEEHGRRSAWGFGPRPRHADADAIGQVWIWGAEQALGAERAARLAPIRARFDAVLAAPSSVALVFDEGRGERPCQVRWCWSDALFMAPPAWVELSAATGDPRYLEHSDREFWATVEALYDREEHLFYRDSRFIGREGPAGRKVFWSRGNGWSYAGVVRVLEALPADHPRRADYVKLFREMSSKLASTQGAEGYWPASLLDPGGPPETSGTGFFVYGLAWGVSEGLLDPEVYVPVVARGWAALDRAIQPDGHLGWVQQVGYAPDHVAATDTQLYGVGAYLLAATQVARRPNW